ncbi:MAG TPA: hypothetical protein VL595_31350 [Pseudonocardia sp.]|nr:hypothetical protein [Pseudonocardia sp.]
MDPQELVTTREHLHGIAELLIAGPQHRAHGTIRLRVTPGGFGGVKSDVRVEASDLVWPGGRAPLTGTCRELAEVAGIDIGRPEGVYTDTSALDPDTPLAVDPTAATVICDWFGVGDAGLRRFAPDAEPVLWPEHFDLGISLDEVNYGISPGDAGHPGPYAYVGPWEPRQGEFWNVSFGALRPAADLPDADAIAAFFAAGREAARR